VILFALIVAVATLAGGLAVAVVVRFLPTLRLQLAVLAVSAALLPLAAVLLSGVYMFSSEHDLTVLAIATASATGMLVGALLVARWIVLPVERLRRASARIGGGELGARAAEEGPTELAELAAGFNRMAAGIEELFDARRELVAWASHDLRTPLASMQAMLEALEDGLAEPERYLPALREQAGKLSALVDDLFELARIDAGALTLEIGEWPVSGLVESCLRGVEAEARARGIALEADVDLSGPRVRCAPDKTERVLYNLLANALRHTPSDGAVAVRVEPLPEEVRFSVEDTGEGFPAESVRRVFERFWRADAARSGDGAGLGLAIARGLVEAQGGRIWAENRPGGGARVSFTLPAA
jgi:signal transduction histidine kinase